MHILEKILRKTKFNIYCLEAITGIFYLNLAMFLTFYFIAGARHIGFYIFLFVGLTLAVMGDMLHITVAAFYMIRNKKI